MIISIIAYIQEGMTWMNYFFIGFVWFSLLLVYGWFGMIVIYDNEGFSRGWFPLQKRRYAYETVTGFDVTAWGYKLYVGHKCISFDDRLIQSDSFILVVSSKYREIHGKKLPIKRKIAKWDIFNGHVEEPAEIIAVLLMLLSITIGFFIWQVIEVNDYKEIEETTCVEVKIEDYIIDENHMILKVENLLSDFEIVRYKEYEEIQSIIEKEIADENNLYIYVLDYKEDEAKKTYEVYCIQRINGESIISLEEKNENDSEFAKSFIPVAVVFLILVLIFCISTIIVGRYHNKFSKRIQRAFFQDGYLH